MQKNADVKNKSGRAKKQNMNKESKIEINILRGSEIIPYIPQVAELRIAIFREFPYLYEGTLSYEEKYLQMYSLSKHSTLIIAQDREKVIGAVTGVPVAEAMDEVKELFHKQKMSTEGVYYLGEIMLLKEYRKKKIGHALFKEFEKSVRSMGGYQKIVLCEINRSDTDVKKPADYIPLDHFWSSQGYTKHSNLIAYYSYQEIGNTEETLHPMIFWMKELL